MLSRFSLKGNLRLGKNLIVFQQPALSVATSPSDTPKTPAESSKRDLVNFPRIPILQKSPPTRFGFIPESWFHFFYPKTGVTGPYMFGAGVVTYLLSKEWIVYEEDFVFAIGVASGFFILQKLKGKDIRNAVDKYMQARADEMDNFQKQNIQKIKDAIEKTSNEVDSRIWVKEVAKAKRESVFLQMEADYRERMFEAYKMVKNRLDCQIELDNVEKRIIKKNLLDYVMKNVMKGLTPEKEKVFLQNCISQIGTLA